MALIVGPSEYVGRDGSSFQECSVDSYGRILKTYERYCTIRDDEKAPPTSTHSRKWKQIFRTPDSTE